MKKRLSNAALCFCLRAYITDFGDFIYEANTGTEIDELDYVL